MTRDDRIKAQAERWAPILKPLSPYEAAEKIIADAMRDRNFLGWSDLDVERVAGALLAVAGANHQSQP